MNFSFKRAGSASKSTSTSAPAPAPKARSGVSVEVLALAASVFCSLISNVMLWRRVLTDRDLHDPTNWLLAASVFVALTAFQFSVLALVLTRRTAKATIAVLLVGNALAAYYMQTFNVLLDTDMLRNVVNTDVREARELLGWPLLWQIVWQALLPIALLWRLPIARLGWQRAVLQRVLAVVGAWVVCAGAVLLVFQDLSAMVRNDRQLRLLVTPSNYVYGLGRLATTGLRSGAAPQAPIGTDARLTEGGETGRKPALLVLVVGETARAANWGLNGYARQTTPELAALDVVNFSDVTSCGTNTEVSLPCMFSPWGRHDYDEDRIRGHQSLLHVLDHAGVDVLWRDNQSGCKNVCSNLPTERLDALATPGLCADGRCFDEILIDGLDPWLARPVKPGVPRLLVLHQLGSHGPAYDSRYPDAFRRFTPACATGDLRKCSQQEIVNAYDNTLLYTDHLLARTIALLKTQEAQYDTALVYVSDHGESLGEHNLYLHGMPYAIAPSEQTHVPMVAWFSPGFAERMRLDLACLKTRAAQPTSHDNLFHTVLGLLQVKTTLYNPVLDLGAACRRSANAS